MQDIFGKIPAIDPKLSTCHSGGATGADTVWEVFTMKYGGKPIAYSHKTPNHRSPNKKEISDADYEEGIQEVNRANHVMNRWNVQKYMSLLARNWAQVKYSQQIVAIGNIVLKGKKNSKGFYNKGKLDVVDGGTGYAVTMGILHRRLIFVFEQTEERWYKWSYQTSKFVTIDPEEVYLTNPNFAGIGTRNINEKGKEAIKYFFENTIKNL